MQKENAAWFRRFIAALILLFVVAEPALGWEGQELLDAARATIEDFRNAENYPTFDDALRRAKAIVIVPRVSVFSLIFYEYANANAVLLTRHPTTGHWGNPAFMKIATQKYKFQPHTEMVAIAFVVMTDEGVERLLSGNAQIGMDVSVADGGVPEFGTSSADVIEFVSGGYEKIHLPLSDATLSVNAAENESYYGRPPILRDIVFGDDSEGGAALRTSLKVD